MRRDGVVARLVGVITAVAVGFSVVVAADPVEATPVDDQPPPLAAVDPLGFGLQHGELLESVRTGMSLAERASEPATRSPSGGTDGAGAGLAAVEGPARLSGRVTAPDGGPAGGICVVVLDQPLFSGDAVASSVTDVDGRYSLDVPAGIYRVLFVDCSSSPRFAYTYLGDETSFGGAEPVILEPGQQLSSDVVLRPEGRVEGVARLAGSGAPVAGICVGVVTDDDSQLIGSTVTGADGSYVVGGLRSRDYQVLFLDCRDQATLAMQWWDRQHAVTAADQFRVNEGAVRTGIDAALQPAGQIAGRLVDQHGEGVDGACVAAVDRDWQLYAAEVTRPDGTYLTQTLPAGQFIVLFGDCLQVPRFQPTWYPSGDFADAVDVAVTPGISTTGINATVRQDEINPLALDLQPSSDVCDQAPYDQSFSDTAENIHADAIDCVAGWQITLGTGDDRFSPQSTVRRDQLASFLARLLNTAGRPLPDPGAVTFADIDGNVHQEAIEALAAAGIVLGTAPSTYDPAAIVRRDQMASFLARTIEYATAGDLPDAPTAGFTDTQGNVHARNIDRLSATGIVLGTTPSLFDPAGQVRRDQMASFLTRTLRHLTALPPDDDLEAFSLAWSGGAGGSNWYTAFQCHAGGRVTVGITTNAVLSQRLYHQVWLGRANSRGTYDLFAGPWTERPVGLYSGRDRFTSHSYPLSSGRWAVVVRFWSCYSGRCQQNFDRPVGGVLLDPRTGHWRGALNHCASPSGQLVM